MSITRRKNGKFTAQIKDPDTKKKVSLGTFSRYSEAQNAINLALDAKKSGEPIKHLSKGKMPFDRFVDEVFLVSPRLRVSPKTREHYKTECRRLKEYFGSKPLNSIKQQDVLQFIEDFRLREDPKTGQTIPRSQNYQRKTAQRLRQIFNVAVEEGYIPANAHPYKKELRANQLPSRPKELNRVMLSHEAAVQILSILDALSKDTTATEEELFEAEYWYYFLGCALHTGLRMSELCGLVVSDLDWQRVPPSVYVHRQWGWNINTKSELLMFPEPKSKSSVRHIPMSDNVFALLNDWSIKMLADDSPYGLMFPRPTPKRRRYETNTKKKTKKKEEEEKSEWGLWGSPSDFSKRYKKMLGRVWVYYANNIATKPHIKKPFTEEDMVVSIHQWRHCYCVTALQAGVDVNTVSKWMGHHSASFTYEVYSRFVKTAEAENLDKLNAVYDKKKQTSIGI